jgi:hypothetical protein
MRLIPVILLSLIGCDSATSLTEKEPQPPITVTYKAYVSTGLGSLHRAIAPETAAPRAIEFQDSLTVILPYWEGLKGATVQSPYGGDLRVEIWVDDTLIERREGSFEDRDGSIEILGVVTGLEQYDFEASVQIIFDTLGPTPEIIPASMTVNGSSVELESLNSQGTHELAQVVRTVIEAPGSITVQYPVADTGRLVAWVYVNDTQLIWLVDQPVQGHEITLDLK